MSFLPLFYRSIKEMICVGLAFTIAACSTQAGIDFTDVPPPTVEYLWDHPVATPQFITSLTTDAGESGFEQDVCISVSEGSVWEKGEFGSDVYNRIQKSTLVRFDGKIVEDLVFYQSPVSINVFNSQKQVIGSHGGGVSVCFNITNPSQGTHLAMIEITSKSGVQYSHTWAIKVP